MPIPGTKYGLHDLPKSFSRIAPIGFGLADRVISESWSAEPCAQVKLAKAGVAGLLGDYEPATGPSAVGQAVRGKPRGRSPVLGAAEGFSGPAQHFESTYRWAGENFYCRR
jgi:hypothetical protein